MVDKVQNELRSNGLGYSYHIYRGHS